MVKKSLLIMMLLALFAPWAANAQETITLTGNVTQTIEPNTTYNFYDSGGPNSNYGTSQNYTATLTADGDITINFSQFVTENSSNCSDWDHMHIYDGNASTGTLLARRQTGCSTATLTTGVDYVASSGTMTIVWKSDNLNVAAGWAATITGPVCCPKPKNLTCTGYTTNTATFTWTNGGEETQWQLEYGTASDFTGASTVTINQSDLVNGAYTLAGLTAEQTYYARIKAYCPSCTPNYSDPGNTCEFKPSTAQIVTIGSGTGMEYYLPTHTNYKYSYSQQIYTAAEIGEPGTITSVSFKGTSTLSRTLDVYMVNTSKASFSSTSDYIAVTEVNRVFSGGVSFVANEWTAIEVNFDYTGENLAIIVDDNTNYDPGSTNWSTFTVSSNQGLYFYKDSGNIDPSSPTGEYQTTTTWKNQIILSILPTATPKPRNLAVSNITSDGATVTWTAPADNVVQYCYQYGPTGGVMSEWFNTEATSVNLTSLTPTTAYTFNVYANYTEGNSDPVEIQFTTLATCIVPEGLAVNDMVATWNDGTASQWNLQYKVADAPAWTPVNDLNAASFDFTTLTLDANTLYEVQVQANCGNGDLSEWSEIVSFITPCGVISNFPWSEDFNSYSASTTNQDTPSSYPNDVMPDCWTFLNRSESSNNYPQVFLSSSSFYAVSGNCLFFKSSSSTPIYAVLPEFGTGIAGLELSFTYCNEGTGTSNGTLYIGYMTDPNDASTFNTENAVACAQNTNKTPMEVLFPNAPANSYFAFKYQGGNGNNYYLAIDDITVKVPVFVTANQIVNTVSDPATEMTWNEFVNHWNDGDHFTNTTFTLMDNITVSTMVGTADKPFTGTFNGNSHTIMVNLTATDNDYTAPFRFIRNVTIQNLKVDGTINDGGHSHCAGFAGSCYGDNIFANCESAVTINATKYGPGNHGGFIAINHGSTSSSNLATTVFNGCAFTGQLLGANTIQSAGFCGLSEYSPSYSNYARTIFNNCLFAPQAVTMNPYNSATFACLNTDSKVNFNNCYFMQDFNDGIHWLAQGKQAYTIAGVDPVYVAFSGEHILYNMSGIDAYTEGMVHGYTKLAGEGDDVTLSLSGAAGYEADHGTLVPNGETFTLTMEAYDTQISGVSCPVPYNVSANDVAARSAQISWTGGSDSYTVQYREVITAPSFVIDTYDFEDGTQGWTTIDADGHGDAWSRSNEEANSGSYSMRATYNSSHDHQDYLVSPQITLGGSFSFYAKKGGVSADTFRVYLSTSGNTSASDFTIELTDGNVLPLTTYKQYTYDLSAYSGMGYVAIVYTAAANQYYLCIDDISITTPIDGEYGEWHTVDATDSPKTIENLNPETTYQVKVSGTCDDVPTGYSDVVEFTTPVPSFTKEILAHSTGEETSGWYLIASPLAETITDLTTVGNLINAETSDNFDLYRFNQSPTMNSNEEYLEWENYKSHTEDFILEPGKGYLYANAEDVTLTFTGTPYTGNGEVTLSYSDENPEENMRGWNLIGNPLGVAATIGDKPYFRMNYTENNEGKQVGGDEIITGVGSIAPMEGIFVQADSNGETVTFSPATTSAPSAPMVAINILQEAQRGASKTIDRAVVRFGEGKMLSKFQLNPNHTKIYIPQDGKDYAVVNAETAGEMPLNFKAENDGRYTMSFNSENVEFSYLHLIDNMTGVETNLLETPSYTFEARTTDYSSRFKLVFATGSNNDSDNFAFYSNGTWVIGNEGEATLQVIDVTGRVLSSETINGSASINVNAAPGVYTLRLVNGNDVKVQKVVVE